MPSNLEAQIIATKSFLAELRVRPGRRTIDHGLARYLWLGIQTSEVINLACQADHPAGTASLRRYLLETVLDIYMLVSSDSPQLDVAKSMVWDVIDWDRTWDHHKKAVAADPSLDTERVQVHTREDAFEVLRSELEGLGEDLSWLDQAIEAAEASRHWHWSGKGPSGRMKELAERAKDDQEHQGVVAMLNAIWKTLSSSSHPSPAWQKLKIEERDETLHFPSTSTGGSQPSQQVVTHTIHMLESCQNLIAQYREMDELEGG